MGLVHSHHLLTQPVTLNRMRFVCQRNSQLPKQLQKFNVELLANDLNKLGFNIKLRDGKGKPLANDKICNEIYKSRPNVERVCMANREKPSSSGVAELVKYFNKYYGTNIPLTVNPMDPRSKRRTIPELCDDMYMVSDKISRRLTDDITGVKKKLLDQIDALKIQQRTLDDAFGRHLSSIRTQGRETGVMMDRMNHTVSKNNAVRAAMIGELGRQVDFAGKLYSNLGAHLDSRFYPHIRHVRGVLDRYYQTPYNGKLGNLKMNVANIMSAVKGLSVATTQCKSCLDKFNLGIDEFYKLNKDEWRSKLGGKLQAASLGLDPTSAEYAGIHKCYNQLLNDSESCGRNLMSAERLSEQANNHVCGTFAPGDDCDAQPWCETDTNADPNVCKMKDRVANMLVGDSRVFRSAEDKLAADYPSSGMVDIKLGGARDDDESEAVDRAAFWVDAVDSEVSELVY